MNSDLQSKNNPTVESISADTTSLKQYTSTDITRGNTIHNSMENVGYSNTKTETSKHLDLFDGSISADKTSLKQDQDTFTNIARDNNINNSMENDKSSNKNRTKCTDLDFFEVS